MTEPFHKPATAARASRAERRLSVRPKTGLSRSPRELEPPDGLDVAVPYAIATNAFRL